MITEQSVFLVVDDADSMRRINSNQLSRLGARQILLANNGLEARKILEARRVDVIVSDWNMPVMSGLDLLLWVRANQKLAHLPFIMITAECEREQVKQLITSGVSSILVKPYNPQDLAQHLARAMRHRPQPQLAVQAKSEAARVMPKVAQRRPTLLVVDDMPDNLSLIAGLFREDYRVRVAQDGSKALAICTSDDPPDLLLLDVMMPNMDGFELASQLRSHPQASRIPLIFITAMDEPDARRKAMELGAVEFVGKPIEPALLRLQVSNLLRHVERHCQVQAEYNGLLDLARLRDDVEQIVRHDLKAPLSGILGLARSLLEGGNLLPGQEHMLRLLEDSSQQVLSMIDLSAVLHRIETGSFELQPSAVALPALLAGMVEAARMTYQSKALVIELDLPDPTCSESLSALGERRLCYSLLNNLLKNACEAAPEGSRVRVQLRAGEQLNVLMENQPAVPPDFRPHFFDKYSSLGKKNGSGLGTYSARQLALAQGGSLELQVDDARNTTRLLLALPRLDALDVEFEVAI
ncbi:response regulator [Pseudomonas sp. GOM6]|uniref:ATP-binding response regulator n=1 Tax=Pseudomonas sp. GOM6 TaxID=3036944 RepID=UPI002409E1E9|nr:response regulator [Pseudomonas sp. GOM6]MDG1582315.1 response regulator [Pseudomonas sp. GOM6]